MLPKSIWENFKSQNFENMINYHSKFDIYLGCRIHCHSDTRKTVNLETGVPTMDGLVNNFHLGYKRKLNPRYNASKNLAVYKIKSVKNITMIKNGKKVKKTIEIDINMDDKFQLMCGQEIQ